MYRVVLGKKRGSLGDFCLKALLWAAIGIFSCASSGAESLSVDLEQLRFDWFEESEDFENISVVALHQDSFGFIWIGTRGGIYRYDGERFVEYRLGLEGRRGLPSGSVERFFEDSKGNLWAGLQQAVVRYDYALERFVNCDIAGFPYRVIHFFENEQGVVGFADQGGSIYELDDSGVFQSRRTGSEDWARCALASGDRSFYLAGRGGIRLFGPDFQERQRFDTSSIFEDDGDSYVTALARVSDDVLWVGTNRYGVWSLNLETGKFSPLKSKTEDQDLVGSILVDDRGYVLVGTTAGLSLYGQDGHFMDLYQWSRYEPTSIPTGTVSAMMNDRQGNLWVGTSRGGLSVVRNLKRFEAIDSLGDDWRSLTKQKVSSVFVDSRDRLWAGYHNEGVDRIDFDPGKKRFFDSQTSEAGALGRGTVWDICETSDGSIWIGTNIGGLSWLKPRANSFKRFAPVAGDPSSIGGLDVRGILPDETGNLWLLLHGTGVDYFDRSTETFTHYGEQGRRWVEDFLLDPAGTLWVGSSGGLSYLAKGASEFVPYGTDLPDDRKLPSNRVVCMKLSAQTGFWVGTPEGLALRLPGEEGFKRYGLESGLPSLSIRSIEESLSGELWIATSAGLARYDREADSFRAFRKGDGLLSDKFNERSAFVSGDGRMYFGSEKGLVSFLPEEVELRQTPSDLLITGLTLFSDPVYPSSAEGSLLQESLLTNRELVFPAGLNTFGFEFAALDYVSGDRKEYEYKLEGFETKWIRNGTRSDCSYTNIPPGDYVFRVRACNSDGVWNGEGVALAITVLPFFWQTNWFIACVVILSVLGGFAVVRIRTATLARQKMMLLETVSARTKDLTDALYELELQKAQIEDQNLELLDHREHLEELIEQRTSELVAAKERAEEATRLKSAFLENISHEIRTPMNAILGFVNILKGGGCDTEEQEEYLDIVEQNGEYLTLLIDDIIEISILESSQAELSVEKVELHGYFENWCEYLRKGLVAADKGSIEATLAYHGAERTETLVSIDPSRLGQVLKNLLDNAVKFTDTGSICLSYDLKDDGIHCEVTDTGIGIPRDKLADVFDVFRKLLGEKKRLYRGAGLGLAIVKRVVELMGGEIHVESERGKGSRFFLRVPVGKAD